MAEAAQSRVQAAIKDFINQIDKVDHKWYSKWGSIMFW